eukprot:scaffold161395_cov35-Tisochrysis_lutea.AAC.3
MGEHNKTTVCRLNLRLAHVVPATAAVLRGSALAAAKPKTVCQPKWPHRNHRIAITPRGIRKSSEALASIL